MRPGCLNCLRRYQNKERCSCLLFSTVVIFPCAVVLCESILLLLLHWEFLRVQAVPATSYSSLSPVCLLSFVYLLTFVQLILNYLTSFDPHLSPVYVVIIALYLLLLKDCVPGRSFVQVHSLHDNDIRVKTQGSVPKSFSPRLYTS